MRILYDLSSNQPQGSMKVNGGGEYSFMVFDYLYANRYDADRFDIILNSSLRENETTRNYITQHGIKKLVYNSLSEFSEIVQNGSYDMLILPVCYQKYHELKIPDSVRVVSVIHDLCDVYYYNNKMVRYGKYPKEGITKFLRMIIGKILSHYRTKLAIEHHNKIINLNNNQTIITVSNYSLASFYKYLNIAYEKEIYVLCPPENRKPVFLNDEIENEVLTRYSIEKNKYFFLCAGCRWAKNNAIALFVLDKMFSNKRYDYLLSEFKVVITGVDRVYRNYYGRHIVNKERFVFEDYVDDVSIETLFKNAHLFIFPSVLEGFGQPPIEAMKYQTLVACSTAMCIPEVCGDAAIFFNPLSETSIELAVIQSFDDIYATTMRKKEVQRVKELEIKRTEDLRKLRNIIYY